MVMIRTRDGEMFTTEKLSEPTRDRMAYAFSQLAARKKIQAKHTYWMVTKMLKYFHAPSAFLLPRIVARNAAPPIRGRGSRPKSRTSNSRHATIRQSPW